jgi:hypothetical protein
VRRPLPRYCLLAIGQDRHAFTPSTLTASRSHAFAHQMVGGA